MNTAPVVVFAYNRPDHLRKTLDALKNNDLAPVSNLFIYCDGPKVDATDEQMDRISKVRSIAKSISGFKQLCVIERPHNLGLKNSIVSAVSEIVREYGRIITLEDDVVTSVGFLQFMNDALEVYQDDEKVMHISAYMYPHKCRLPETFFYPVPYPGGGWGTWERSWRNYNDNTQELYGFWKNRWEEFDLFGGDYLSSQLKNNLNGTLSSWFVKWYAVLLQRGGLTLYPGKSLTNNIGFDELSTNCYKTNKFDVVPVNYVAVKKTKVVVNRTAKRIIYDFYQGHWYNKRRRNALKTRIIKLLRFWE